MLYVACPGVPVFGVDALPVVNHEWWEPAAFVSLGTLPAHEVERLLGPHPETTVEVVEGTDHFLAGAVTRIADRAATWLADQLEA